MVNDTLQEQLDRYLTDAHAIEEQALQQLRMAPDITGDPDLSTIFREHVPETERHEALVRARLEARKAKPSKAKDAVMRAGGVGFVLFAQAQPDTPGKLMAHAYSYESLEWAAYDLLMRVADRAGDGDTVETARRIRDEEDRMRGRVAGGFDRAVEASLASVSTKTADEQLVDYLADAHALEAQSIQLLKKAPDIAGEPELERIYSEHLEETNEHQRLMRARLDAHEATPSTIKDAGLRMGALNWGMFFQAQRDTAGKLAAFAYAVEHLEIAGYEELKRVGSRAGDDDTVEVAERILAEERAAAERIASAFDRAAEASIAARGVTL